MVSLCPQKSLSNKDNSGLLESNLFAIWDPSATPQDDDVKVIGFTPESFAQTPQSNFIKTLQIPIYLSLHALTISYIYDILPMVS